MFKKLQRNVGEWRQIYVQVLLISVVTAAINGAALVQKNIRVEKSERNRDLSEVVNMASLLAPIVDGFDLVSVGVIGDSLTAHTYVVETTILGPGGYVMYRSEPLAQDTQATFPRFQTPITLVGDDGVEENVGSLVVRLMPERMFALYVDAIKSSLLIFLTIAVAGLLTAMVYVKRSIAKPLKQLQDAVEQTLTLGRPVESKTIASGFVGKFQSQFNRMQGQLLRSQLELRNKSADLEANSNLIREVLDSVRQAVRLYNPPGFSDFGNDEINFPFPEAPMATIEEFTAYLASCRDLADCRIEPSHMPVTASRSILFDADLRFESGRTLNVKSVNLSAGLHALLISDITAAKDLELSLQHVQKMEVVAMLTSGIAHDFNNVLSIITGNLELIEHQADNKTEVLLNAEQALNASRRAAAVVTSLLSFSKRKPKRLSSIAIADVLAEVETIARVSIGSNFKLTTHCTVDANLKLDLASLESSLINLIMNARDATTGGGAIRLTARMATSAELKSNQIKPNRPYIAVSVIDEGTGVPEELHDRITESFFTTKAHGSGLGLAMVKGFAEGVGGQLYFRANKSRGMTFSLLLPCSLAADSAVASRSSSEPLATTRKTGLTVLLVEDEVTLLTIMGKIFTVSGYDCISCTGIGEVRDYLARGGALPDIVVSDLNLEDGLGCQLAGEEFPELATLPKILLSGNMETAGAKVDISGFDEVCLKPIESSALLSIVARLTSAPSNVGSVQELEA